MPIHTSAVTAADPGEQRVTGAPAIPILWSASFGIAMPTAFTRVSRVAALITSSRLLPCSRAVTAPASSTITARGAPVRSTPSVVIVVVQTADVPLRLAPFERKRTRPFGAKELSIHLSHQTAQPSLVGG